MFSVEYLNSLNQYTGKVLRMEDKGNEAILYVDAEINYVVSKEEDEYVVYIQERGRYRKQASYTTQKELYRMFALMVKSLDSSNVPLKYLSDSNDVPNEKVLREVMEKQFDVDSYSINCPKSYAMNLEKISEDIYDIYFMRHNGEKKYIEEKLVKEEAFFRFYNEAVYFCDRKKKVDAYEKCFDDVLSSEEKIDLIGM